MLIDRNEYKCSRCTMSFRIQPGASGVERFVCPQCRLRFWSTGTTVGMVVRVGVEPEEVLG